MLNIFYCDHAVGYTCISQWNTHSSTCKIRIHNKFDDVTYGFTMDFYLDTRGVYFISNINCGTWKCCGVIF